LLKESAKVLEKRFHKVYCSEETPRHLIALVSFLRDVHALCYFDYALTKLRHRAAMCGGPYNWPELEESDDAFEFTASQHLHRGQRYIPYAWIDYSCRRSVRNGTHQEAAIMS